MGLKKIAICAAALVAATIASQFAQAGGKGGGASSSAPGQQVFTTKTPQTEPGKSQFAPGDIKHDPGTTAKNASDLAPGDKINNSKK